MGPEGCNPELNTWRLDKVPFFPEPFLYSPIEVIRDQYEVVAKFMTRDDAAMERGQPQLYCPSNCLSKWPFMSELHRPSDRVSPILVDFETKMTKYVVINNY